MTQFAERVRLRTEKLKLTQEEVAERAHMPLRKYQRILQEKFKTKLADAAAIAIALETSTDYLAGNTDDDRPLVDEATLSIAERIARRLAAGDRIGAARLVMDEELPNDTNNGQPQQQQSTNK